MTFMTTYVPLVLAAIVIVLQGLDVWTTNRFLAKGTGMEGNTIVAWLIDKLGSWWWLSKIPVVALAGILSQLGLPGACGLAVLTGVYSFVVWSNYRLGS
jgi:hypothetical protein